MEAVTKEYDRRPRSFRWKLAAPRMREQPREPHLALAGVDLEVRAGEAVGIIGPNGAGKSTLLKLVAGVTRPTRGSVTAEGTVASMIELSLGFHPELTGRENAACGLVMRGCSRHDLDDAIADILAFAELEAAAETPVKWYSLGMRARLSFAVATHTRADVLVIDEVLAVGDQDFQERCIERVMAMVEAGSAMLFVSHDMTSVAAVCDRVVHLRRGSVVDDGPPLEVIPRYLSRSSRGYPTDPAAPMRFRSLDVPPTLASWSVLRATAEVEVLQAVRQPLLGVDLTLPLVDPDLVLASSKELVSALSQPGRYRLDGVSSPFGIDAGDFALVFSLVDGDRQRRVAAEPVELAIGGGRAVGRPGLAVEPVWDIRPVEPRLDRAPSHRRGPVDGDPDAAVVSVQGLDKRYRLSSTRAVHVAAAVPGIHQRARRDDVLALHDVDLAIHSGESVGIIGPNGAGKSTLLRILAGVTAADAGSVVVRGRVLPLLDPGSGLHPELTGDENIRLVGRLLGLSRRQIRGCRDAVAEMSGLGDALGAQAKQYSTGMLARLGFSIAMQVPAELILIDELLAVGDEEFRRAALKTVMRRRDDGAAVAFVSHDLRLVEELCQRVLRIEHGRVVDEGPASEVVDAYGGHGWSRGTLEVASGVRLLPIAMPQRRIPIGGRLELSGTVIVDEPSPGARIELSYRTVPEDRSAPMTEEERVATSMYVRTVVPPGGWLSRPGWYDYRAVIDRNEFKGDIDVVVAVRQEEALLAEAWQHVVVGGSRPEGFPSLNLSFDWTVTPLGS